MNKLPLIKSVNNLTHMKSIKSLSLEKNVIELSIIKKKKKKMCYVERYYSSAFVVASVFVVTS
jgi:hypothetical protein